MFIMVRYGTDQKFNKQSCSVCVRTMHHIYGIMEHGGTVVNPFFLPFCYGYPSNQTITVAGCPVPKLPADAQH